MATTQDKGIVKRPGAIARPTLSAVPPAAVPPAETKGDDVESKFAGGAPDAKPAAAVATTTGGVEAKKAPRRARPRKQLISITLMPELIEAVDAASQRLGQSRAAWISAVISRALQEQ